MALTKIPASLLDTTGGLDLQGNITLGDNEQIQLGADGDLAIYHSGAHSFITDSGTGNLRLQGTNLALQNAAGTKNYFLALDGGASTIYYDNNPKIATSSTGATVTGNLAVTGDLDITGNVNSASVTDLDVTDKTITLGAGQTEALSGGSGIIIDGSGASILWDETNGRFDFNNTVNVTSGNVKIDGNQVGLNHVAHGIASGNSVANNFQIGRWKGGTFDRWMLVPVNNGSEQYSDEFGYNFNTGAWFFDNKVGIGTSSPGFPLHVDSSSTDVAKFQTSGSYTYTRFQNSSKTWALSIGSDFGFYDEAASATRMIIDSSGNVNIGNGIAEEKRLIIDCSNPLLVLKETDQAVDSKVWATQSIASKLYFRAMNDALSSATDVMILDRSGNVGIGTDSPLAKLQVTGSEIGVYGGNSTTGPGIFLGDSLFANSNYYNSAPGIGAVGPYGGVSAGLAFYVYGSQQNSRDEAMRIDSSGNVGIGTDSPVEKLDVNGSVKGGNVKIQPSDGGRIGFNRNTADGAIYNSGYSAFQINGAYSGANFLDFQEYTSAGTFNGAMKFQDGKLAIGSGNGNFSGTPENAISIAHDGHGLGLDYVGATLPRTAGMYTSSTAHTATAYGDLNIKARTDYGNYYGIGFFTAPSNANPQLRLKIAANGSVTVNGPGTASHSFEVQDRSDGYSMFWAGRSSSGVGRGLTTSYGLMGVNSSQYDYDGAGYPVAGFAAAADNTSHESVDFWFGSTQNEWQPMVIYAIGASTQNTLTGQTAGWACIRATHFNNGISAAIVDSGGGGTFTVSVQGTFGADRANTSRVRVTYEVSGNNRTVVSAWVASYSGLYGAVRA